MPHRSHRPLSRRKADDQSLRSANKGGEKSSHRRLLLQRFCKDRVAEMEKIFLSLADTCLLDVDLGGTSAARRLPAGRSIRWRASASVDVGRFAADRRKLGHERMV